MPVTRLYAALIYATVKRIEKKPGVGDYLTETRRLYVDREHGFRIGYNYHSPGKNIEIVTINIEKK